MNHVWLNAEMNPVTRRLVRGSKFVKLDDLTFQYVFPEPNPMFAGFFAHYGSQFADPMHFFRQYHPAYRNRDELDALAKEKGAFPLFDAEKYLASESLKNMDQHVRDAIAGQHVRGRCGDEGAGAVIVHHAAPAVDAAGGVAARRDFGPDVEIGWRYGDIAGLAAGAAGGIDPDNLVP